MTSPKAPLHRYLSDAEARKQFHEVQLIFAVIANAASSFAKTIVCQDGPRLDVTRGRTNTGLILFTTIHGWGDCPIGIYTSWGYIEIINPHSLVRLTPEMATAIWGALESKRITSVRRTGSEFEIRLYDVMSIGGIILPSPEYMHPVIASNYPAADADWSRLTGRQLARV